MNIAKRPSPRHTIAVAAAVLAFAPSASAGDGTFGGGRDHPVAYPADVAVGDFNYDGRPDLAAVSTTNDRVELLLQTREGELEPAAPVPVGNAPELLAVADFNADGRDDLAVANYLDHDVSVRLGTGNATFRATTDIQLGAFPSALVVGDFNNDAHDDLATAVQELTGNRQQIFVSLGAGDGGFPAAKTLPRDAEGLVVGDFNSDAIEDLAYGGYLNAKAGQVSPGTGSGEVGEPLDIGLPAPATYAHGLATGDFNADGMADIVASHDTNAVSVRLGGGNGTFPTGKTVPVEGNPRAVAVGDFNSDGNEDFVVTNTAKPGAAHIRLGDGAGGFRPGADLTVGLGPTDVAVADFNSDGNDDLAIANTDSHSVSVRMGGGQALLAGNLLVNGDFEGRLPGSAPLDGWELTGGIYYLRYGTASHAFTPSWLAAPRFGTGGSRMLLGGASASTNGITAASQAVDVSASAEAIDAGRATANLSAYLGGARAYGDRMAARADFRGGAGEALGSLELGPVTAEDRHNVTTLLLRAGSAVVPASTRTIRVTLTSIDDDKAFSSAIADNVKLTLTTTPAPEQPRPEPGEAPPPTARFGPDTLVTLAPARTRIGARQSLTVRVRNRNAFAVTGRLRGAATVRAARIGLPARSLELPQATARTVRVRLPAQARRQLTRTHMLRLSLTAVVTDPAGNPRRVTKRIRLRLRSN